VGAALLQVCTIASVQQGYGLATRRGKPAKYYGELLRAYNVRPPLVVTYPESCGAAGGVGTSASSKPQPENGPRRKMSGG
jgi:hypothetical protein